MLLDTCSLIWLTSDLKKLSKKSKAELRKDNTSLSFSSISIFEIGTLIYRKKIVLPRPLDDWISAVVDQHDLIEIPINAQIASLSTRLARHHNDPFDRIIIATAVVNDLKILTPDKDIARYEEVGIIW